MGDWYHLTIYLCSPIKLDGWCSRIATYLFRNLNSPPKLQGGHNITRAGKLHMLLESQFARGSQLPRFMLGGVAFLNGSDRHGQLRLGIKFAWSRGLLLQGSACQVHWGEIDPQLPVPRMYSGGCENEIRTGRQRQWYMKLGW